MIVGSQSDEIVFSLALILINLVLINIAALVAEIILDFNSVGLAREVTIIARHVAVSLIAILNWSGILMEILFAGWKMIRTLMMADLISVRVVFVMIVCFIVEQNALM